MAPQCSVAEADGEPMLADKLVGSSLSLAHSDSLTDTSLSFLVQPQSMRGDIP